jgi:hypothetical protein
MSFSRPIQWYHSHADPIWPDGTFKYASYVQVRTPTALLLGLLRTPPSVLGAAGPAWLGHVQVSLRIINTHAH